MEEAIINAFSVARIKGLGFRIKLLFVFSVARIRGSGMRIRKIGKGYHEFFILCFICCRLVCKHYYYHVLASSFSIKRYDVVSE